VGAWLLDYEYQISDDRFYRELRNGHAVDGRVFVR
jgi:hypothetical protein